MHMGVTTVRIDGAGVPLAADGVTRVPSGPWTQTPGEVWGKRYGARRGTPRALPAWGGWEGSPAPPARPAPPPPPAGTSPARRSAARLAVRTVGGLSDAAQTELKKILSNLDNYRLVNYCGFVQNMTVIITIILYTFMHKYSFCRAQNTEHTKKNSSLNGTRTASLSGTAQAARLWRPATGPAAAAPGGGPRRRSRHRAPL